MDDWTGARADPLMAALSGKCPRCGLGPLYHGVLALRERCSHCGLDLARFNVGDGPAAFAILIVGAVLSGLALWTEFRFEPPVWLHIMLWPPVALALTLGALRGVKSWLLAAEYQHKAAEARLMEEERP
jgi:uncharacterized protein (DUF983 family)